MKSIKQYLVKKIPKQLIIQITDACNAKCPQCGMSVRNNYIRFKPDVRYIKKVIDVAAQEGIDIISFTGGEPFLFLEELLELINYAGKCGIEYIRTGTNGFLFQYDGRSNFEDQVKHLAERLASTPIRNFWISLDSAVDYVHEKMRGLTNIFKGLEKALPIFHRFGLFPAANLGINRNLYGEYTYGLYPEGLSLDEYKRIFYERYTEGFKEYFNTVINLGFQIVGICYPMSIKQENSLKAVYSATSEDRVVAFTKEEKVVLYEILLKVIPMFRKKIKIFSPLCSLYALLKQYKGDTKFPNECLGGKSYFFLTAKTGNTYPCGYRGGESFGNFLDRKWCKPLLKHCISCDWECFRDPSELIGPLLNLLQKPVAFLYKCIRDTTYLSYWTKDVSYYFRSRFFSGRN